ncbi:DNA polymerase III subunit alpha [Candidatus Uhrbacteria bacterium]|nr:DNA polymerase III subunit alpha [Candidatus Uhrbacteria bacterium]
MKFVNLHVHSHYSLLDGLSKFYEFVQHAKEVGMSALALTDHGALYGAIEFYQACTAAGIKPIIGVETYLTSRGRHKKSSREDDERFHLLLLAKNFIGYKNLIKLVTAAHLEGFYYKPRIDFELLETYHEGIIASSACINGQIGQAILRGSDPDPVLKQYYTIFGKDFYLELQHHPSLSEQQIINKGLVQLSKKHGIPLIATTDSHYFRSEDAEAHDVLLCLQTKKEKKDTNRLCMLGEDFSFVSWQRTVDAFCDDIPQAIENTCMIADQCDLKIPMGKTILPNYDLPPEVTTESHLHALCDAGVEFRYGQEGEQNKEIQNRLSYELDVIISSGFAAYFLIVQDFVNWAKKQGIIVGPGRGSAAGSLVAYLLNITNIDPLKYDLLFERFLNPARVSMPDIDLDFADTRRDEVLGYVEKKYGKEHVAHIITFGTMAARVSVRDVGRVLGAPYTFCDTLAKAIPMHMGLSESLEKVQEFRALYDAHEQARQIVDIAKKLEGVARHTSMHACGVVITEEPVSAYAPCQYVSPDDKTVVTQYSLHPIEDLGLLKIDFLGLSNLTILENARNFVKKTQGLEIDFNTISFDDKKTFALLREGRTTGVFQLESGGMKRYLKMLKPTEIEDIIAMVALYRPGPIELIPDYIAGKHGKRVPTYLHEKLRPILEKTNGVAVYQEQLMKIAQDLAGFSLGEADLLRKAVGKKIAKLLKEQKEKFIKGCVKNGVSKSVAEKVFEFIEPFAGYGFNRSHAACYAVIAYHTAFMKANYPAEFMAALLTSDQDAIDRIAVEVEECRQMGIEVLQPDVNESDVMFTAVAHAEKSAPDTIRFGLLAVKNVGEHIAQEIITEREKNGTYANLENFLQRVQDKDMNKKSLESLIRSGALDRFGDRNEMYYNSDKLLSFNRKISQEQHTRQTSLFGSSFSVSTLRLDPAPALDTQEKLAWERELLGLYISQHPMQGITDLVRRYVIPCRQAKSGRDGTPVKVCGVITQSKKILTRKNEPMLFAKIEDTSDSIEVIVFPKLYKDTLALWQDGSIIAIDGAISLKDAETKIICNKARLIDAAVIANLKDIAKKDAAQPHYEEPVPTLKDTYEELVEQNFLYEFPLSSFEE